MQVSFHGMAVGGDAVGRDEDGRVIFAPFAAPGEVADVAIEDARKSFARGRILDLQVLAPQRVAPPCPVFGRCGSCQWQHLDYAAQLEIKRGFVVDALSRIGHLPRETLETIVAPCVASPDIYAYRNKADFVVENAPASTCGAEIGFYARQSHDLVPIEQCPIQQTSNNHLLQIVRELLPEMPRELLRRVAMRTDSAQNSLLLLRTSASDWDNEISWAQKFRARAPQCVGVLRQNEKSAARVLDGRDWLQENVDGLQLRVTGGGFFQVNSSITPALLQTVRRLANVQNGQRALDLFCGVGLFALDMARGGAQVLGVESGHQAVRDAKNNAQRNNLAAEFVSGDAARALKSVSFRPDLVVLDPPRAGASTCLPQLLRLQPQKLVYVSCDAATLARDVAQLKGEYRLQEVVPLDLFPQTSHVETVALLERF